jgi:hypothetical protein
MSLIVDISMSRLQVPHTPCYICINPCHPQHTLIHILSAYLHPSFPCHHSNSLAALISPSPILLSCLRIPLISCHIFSTPHQLALLSALLSLRHYISWPLNLLTRTSHAIKGFEMLQLVCTMKMIAFRYIFLVHLYVGLTLSQLSMVFQGTDK